MEYEHPELAGSCETITPERYKLSIKKLGESTQFPTLCLRISVFRKVLRRRYRVGGGGVASGSSGGGSKDEGSSGGGSKKRVDSWLKDREPFEDRPDILYQIQSRNQAADDSKEVVSE